MENLDLIKKVAWNFHEKFRHIELNEFIQEAAEGYCKGLKTYTPEKGKITTHMWHCMYNQIYNYLKHEREWSSPLCEISEASDVVAPNTDRLSNLPNEVKTAIEVIFANPALFDTLSPNEARRIFRRMQYSEGRTLRDVRRIELTLRSILSY